MDMIMIGGAWFVKPRDRSAATKAGAALYIEVKSPSEELDLGLEAILDDALTEFGLGRGVGVKWFAAADCPPAWRVPGGESFTDVPGLNGRVDSFSPRTIWLRRGLEQEQKGDAMFWTALHEIEHTRQELKGECRGVNTAALERKANAYADSLLPGYRRRAA